jgi:hypothetical protein
MCEWNILGTRMEASFPLSQNGVWHLAELMPHSGATPCSSPPRAPPAERPPPSLLHGELRCSPSPSQNGSYSSCSFSLWSSWTSQYHCWPPEGIIAVGNLPCGRCSATSTVMHHLGEPHRPSSCTAHAPWSPLARVGYLLPPRPPTSHHRPRCRTDRSHGNCALRGRRAPQPQLARPASRPCAQPMAMAACHAKWTMSPRGRGLRAGSQPMSRKMFFFFQNSENE